MKATRRVLAPRGQPDRLFGCHPVGCEQILLPRGSQARRIRYDRLEIRRMSVKVFMDVTKYETEQIRWMVIIHLVFVVSGVLLAAMDWIANHAKALKRSKTSKV